MTNESLSLHVRKWAPSKHERLIQCCFNLIITLKQLWINVSCLLGLSLSYLPVYLSAHLYDWLHDRLFPTPSHFLLAWLLNCWISRLLASLFVWLLVSLLACTHTCLLTRLLSRMLACTSAWLFACCLAWSPARLLAFFLGLLVA